MSYLTQARLAGDSTVVQRVTACAASEEVQDPNFWAQNNMWRLSAQPGWVAAYQESESDPPGADESAITDSMILAAVQKLRPHPDPA